MDVITTKPIVCSFGHLLYDNVGRELVPKKTNKYIISNRKDVSSCPSQKQAYYEFKETIKHTNRAWQFPPNVRDK